MISVIVPTRRNSPDLEECLKSLRKQTRNPDEIIIVFDGKTDKTLAKKYGARIVHDTNGTIGGAYASGVKNARGNIIVFTDDDCVAPTDWLKKISDEFNKEDIDILGGEDILPSNSSFFQKAAYQIDKARIMNKAVYGNEAKNRLRAANIAYRKRVFAEDNFNPKLTGLQEPEFHHRLFKKSFIMKFNPKLCVYHKRRNSLRDIFMQIYRNGRAKCDVLKLHKDAIAFIDVFPFIYTTFSVIMAYLALNSGNWAFFQAWILATSAYFLLKPIFIVAKTGEPRYYPCLFLIIFVREVAYSLGIFAGLKSIFKR